MPDTTKPDPRFLLCVHTVTRFGLIVLCLPFFFVGSKNLGLRVLSSVRVVASRTAEAAKCAPPLSTRAARHLGTPTATFPPVVVAAKCQVCPAAGWRLLEHVSIVVARCGGSESFTSNGLLDDVFFYPDTVRVGLGPMEFTT